MCAPEGAEGDDGAHLGVVRRVERHGVGARRHRAFQGVAAAADVAAAPAGDGRAVVQEDADVDAHDGHDTAHVQVHHEHSLERRFREIEMFRTLH